MKRNNDRHCFGNEHCKQDWRGKKSGKNNIKHQKERIAKNRTELKLRKNTMKIAIKLERNEDVWNNNET